MCNKLRRLKGILKTIDTPVPAYDETIDAYKRKLSSIRFLVKSLEESIEDETEAQYEYSTKVFSHV